MLSIYSVLSLFLLLVIASIAFFISKKIKLPYTVLLVLIGILLASLSEVPGIGAIFEPFTNVQLTPELLFYIFLPILIFESAFNMNVRKMIDSFWAISMLSIVGLLISTIAIAAGLYFIFPLVGLSVPFIVTLLFGAVISATDPVAVLALFREFGAPKRLTMIFEGESLFNDGTAVALFMVLLSVAQEGFHGAATVFDGLSVFLMMVLLGIAFGIAIAMLFSYGLQHTKSNSFVSITLLIVSAHLTFILGELINEHQIFGMQLHVSSIIATTVSSLFLGNYARFILSPRSDEYLNKSIEHLAFIANSLVFVLAGILFASAKSYVTTLLWPVVITVLVVASARILSIYAVVKPLNALNIEAKIPASWQKLMAWGSLRGALAIIVVLLLPDDFTVGDWAYAFSIKELLLALTIGCILATLFIKAITIGPLIKKLQINKPTPFRQAYKLETGMYYLLTEEFRFREQKDRSFVKDKYYEKISKELSAKIKSARQEQKELSKKHGKRLFEQTLRYAAVNIENHYLKELYSNSEINETVYRRIIGKLRLQLEKIEHGKYEEIDPTIHLDRKDIFDNIVNLAGGLYTKNKDFSPFDKYQFYRAQSIISRKVIKTFSKIQEQYGKPVFDKDAYKKVVKLYESYRETNEQKMQKLFESNSELLEDYVSEMSKKALHSSGKKAFTFMSSKDIISEPIIAEIEHDYSI